MSLPLLPFVSFPALPVSVLPMLIHVTDRVSPVHSASGAKGQKWKRLLYFLESTMT